MRSVEQAGLSSLSEGQKVSFDIEPGRDGKSSALSANSGDRHGGRGGVRDMEMVEPVQVIPGGNDRPVAARRHLSRN